MPCYPQKTLRTSSTSPWRSQFEKCHVNLSNHVDALLRQKGRLGGWLSSDPSLCILVVMTPDLHPTHLPYTKRSSNKRPPVESKPLSSQETRYFPLKGPKPLTYHFLLNKKRVCRQEGVGKSVARICTALTPPPSERAQVYGLGLQDTSPPTRPGAAAVSREKRALNTSINGSSRLPSTPPLPSPLPPKK